MRVNFETIILDGDFDLQNKIYYITGNEETLIYKIEKTLIEKLSCSDDYHVERVDSLNTEESGSLFYKKKLTVLSSSKNLDDNKLDDFLKNNKDLIIVCENYKGDTSIKKKFEKRKDLVLIFCYELNSSQKVKILNHYIGLNNLKIEKDAFWYIVEKTENKYLFFENDIKKIVASNRESYSLNEIKKILTGTNNDDYYKLLFSVLRKNSDLVGLYYLSINSLSDLYKLIQVTKNCFEMVIASENLQEFEKNIPRYMFKEKQNFLTIYNKTNAKNKGEIFKLIFKTEKLIRKNSVNYFTIGNRFLLNLKKNILAANA